MSTLFHSITCIALPEIERICIEWKEKQPKGLVATWLLSLSYEAQNKTEKARILWSELDLFEEKRKKEAITFAERVVQTYNGSAFAWTFLGSAQRLSEMNKEAQESVNRAVSLDENCILAWNNKGALLDEMGNHEEAIKCYEKAIVIMGKSGDSASIEYLLETLKDKKNPVLQVRAAEALGRLGDLRAVPGLCLGLKSEDIGVRLQSAESLLNLREKGELQLETVIKEYKEALQTHPNTKDAAMLHYALGTLYQLQGKNDIAIQEYQKGLSINSKDVLTHVGLSAIYRTRGTIAGGKLAASELEKAVSLNPLNIALLLKIAREYIEIGGIYSDKATDILLSSGRGGIDFGRVQNYNNEANYYFNLDFVQIS